MPLLTPQLPDFFNITTFGAQYHGNTPSESKAALIAEFDTALKAAAVFVEDLINDDTERDLGLSRVWISYWKSPEAFQTWWNCPETKQFWAALPEDAGFWRESLRFSNKRFVTEMSQDIPSGVGHLGPMVPLTEKTGYWGALRDRLQESTNRNILASSIDGVPEPKAPTGDLRRGRVKITKFPDNICFVVEGQDRTTMTGAESKLWSEKFHRNTKRFITNVVRSGPDAGMLSARLCHVPESGKTKIEPSYGTDDPDFFPALDFNRCVQIFFFLEFRYMERAGRREKSHVALRREFMEAYEPAGCMAHGNMLVWVDCGVVKSQDIEAEYVGCYDGTGFLAYDHHPDFKSTVNGQSKLQGLLSYVGLA
ncbi:putative aldoxime dehydratase protein [Phaeoacremonium minimum UCRPA7]|uniref:Putative aldoxime dehydratase protein n=1 Tax=Phaeoacremonium minimum (strain UCR-PA7) TaxID=1286976 RepID=R8BET2_PHAM7|nr:putative aldoxime dehydratase protein [Phaeoacremonium minimum UCRPA7]EON97808.1 putative aldoxime dehydratase protein [Phaeoacremonium minimum UCRPA7]